MSPHVRVQVWSVPEVERFALTLEEAAEIAAPTLRRAAVETAFALRCTARALEWADESDPDVLDDVVERLDRLKVDAERILSTISALAETSGEEDKTVVRRYAPPPPSSEEPTVVRDALRVRIRRTTPAKLVPPRLART